MDTIELVKELIRISEHALAEDHDSSKHIYKDDPSRPGMCAVCGWLKPQNVFRPDARKALEKLRIIRVVLENGTEEQKKVFEEDVAMLEDLYNSMKIPGYNYNNRN